MLCLFRIQPRDSRLYYTVRVFATLGAMRAYARHHRSAHLGRHFKGLASSWIKQHGGRGAWRTSRHAGELLLVRDHCGAEIVSHECAHLALAWARRRKLDPMLATGSLLCDTDEERFCYALGELVSATYRQLWRRKLVA